MDTDVKVIKSFDTLLEQKGFMCFEDGINIASAVIAAVPQHPLIKIFKNIYETGEYSYNNIQEANTQMMTRILKTYGLLQNNTRQEIDFSYANRKIATMKEKSRNIIEEFVKSV